MADPIVYGPAFSMKLRSVRLALEWKSVPYSIRDVDVLGGGHLKPDHLARHPFGKVPVLEHDGFVVYETQAILRYVDDAFKGLSLQPAHMRSRARMAQIMGIIDFYCYPSMATSIVMERFFKPLLGGSADENLIAQALPQAQTCIDVLNRSLATNPYLAGTSPSLADILLIPIIDYFRQTPEGARLLTGGPNLQSWWQRISEHPGIEKTRPTLGS